MYAVVVMVFTGAMNSACVVQEVMLRRLKREVMSQLPAKRRQVVRLPRPRPSDWPPAGGSPTQSFP